MEISIIIPFYNAEKYLTRCLDSVLDSLDKIDGEVLLVDNCSTDKSLMYAKEYQKKNPGIFKILRCATPGAAAARNLGAKKAIGKYIWFVDADDRVSKTAVTKLLKEAKKTDAELVMLGMERIYPDGKKDYLSAVRPDEDNYKSRFVRYGLGPVQVLIKRDFWEKNKFNFKEGIIHEDMELMSALILHTEKYAAIDEPLYHYYQNKDSVLHKTQFDPHIFDIFVALPSLFKRFKDAEAEQTFHDELEWFFIWNLLIDSAKDFAKFPEGKHGFCRSREILKQYFPEWRKNRFLKQKPLRLRLLVLYNYFR